MPEEVQKIADGYNMEGSVLPLDELSPPLFDRVFAGFRNRWTPAPVRKNGLLLDVIVGKPKDAWVVPVATAAEARLIMEMGPYVTIYTMDFGTGEWHYYNAIKTNPTLDPDQWTLGEWDDLVFTFTELDLIS